MPAAELNLNAADLAIIDHLRESWRIDLEPLQKQIQAVMQRSSRPPGSNGIQLAALDAPMPLGQQLFDNPLYQAFTKSLITRASNVACELRLPSNRKSAVSGVSPSEYLPQRIWGAAQFPLRLKEIMPVMPVTSGSVEYTQETSFTPSAAVVPETQLKPTMAITFAEAVARCSTVASVVKVSKQSLLDVGLMNQWLSSRLSYSVSLKEEDLIVNGDGAGVQGLMQLATPYTVAPLSTDNSMDVIARAAGALMAKGYAVDGVVMNSDDYTSARLLKATTGQYLFVGTASTGPDDESVWESTPLVWQIPMVVSPSMPAGSFLVGSFQMSTILFSRELLTVEIAFQNEDDFVRNLATLRGELRSGLAVPVPAGILKGTLPAGSTQAVGGTFTGAPIGGGKK